MWGFENWLSSSNVWRATPVTSSLKTKFWNFLWKTLNRPTNSSQSFWASGNRTIRSWRFPCITVTQSSKRTTSSSLCSKLKTRFFNLLPICLQREVWRMAALEARRARGQEVNDDLLKKLLVIFSIGWIGRWCPTTLDVRVARVGHPQVFPWTLGCLRPRVAGKTHLVTVTLLGERVLLNNAFFSQYTLIKNTNWTQIYNTLLGINKRDY